MPQVVPVSDFRADIRSVSRYTDEGEVVVLTQNGRPRCRWAMIDYAEWNAAARARERAFARAIIETEERELVLIYRIRYAPSDFTAIELA